MNNNIVELYNKKFKLERRHKNTQIFIVNLLPDILYLPLNAHT